jgi:hypothetical protein
MRKKKRRKNEAPNPVLRAAILEIVHNKLREGTPPETRATLERLVAGGHQHDRAIEMIGCVVSSEIFDVLNESERFNEARYVKALHALPTMPWDSA